MTPAPTFSSFPIAFVPDPSLHETDHRDRLKRHKLDRGQTTTGDNVRGRRSKRVSGLERREAEQHEREVLPATRSHRERSPDTIAFKDVVFDRARFDSTYTLNPPRYSRRAQAIVGCDSLFRVNHTKEQRGLEIGSRDVHSGPSRLPLEAPPHKIRRLTATSTFDDHQFFVPFPLGVRNDGLGSDSEFEQEFADLPRSDLERRSRLAALEKQLREDPKDIDCWLRYSTQHLPATLSDPLDGPFDLASAEVTLSILERALAVNTSATLHLAYVRVARHICSPAQLKTRWQTILAAFPLAGPLDALPVWTAYLGWCESDGFGTFNGNIDDIVAVYSQVIECVRGRSLEAPRGSRVDLETSLLHLVLRAAKFLQNSGYEERGFGILQALMEITFLKPPQHIAPASNLAVWWYDILSEFRSFWDSETPRFGEESSTGWSSGIRPVNPTVPESDPETNLDDWYANETTPRPTQYLLSCRDPNSVVLFDDIAPFLVPIISAQAREQAIYILLNFLRVYIPPPDVSTNSAQDPFLYTYNPVTWPKEGNKVYPWIETPSKTCLSDLSLRIWAFDVDTLFPSPKEWFSHAKAEADARALRCMSQLQPFIPDPRFTMIMLAIDPKSAPVRAKAMLAEQRDNLNLWYAYAALEISRHRYKAARSVFANALSYAKTLRSAPGEDELDLLAGWVQLESDLGEVARAVDLLVLVADYAAADFIPRASPDFIPMAPSSSELLRAARCQANRDSFRLTFFYNTLVRNDLSACVSHESDEATLQFLARQLWLSRNREATKKLSSTLEIASKLYPNNTMFQTLRLRLTERRSQRAAERYIESTQLTIVQTIWGIEEMGRLAGSTLWKRDGSGASRLRLILQRAINSSQGRQSLAVWKAYINFESKMGSGVKQLCYRAVAVMGSCKELYLLPFSPSLRAYFTPRELSDWLLLMVERGIRIRAPFEHLVEADDESQLSVEDVPGNDDLAFLQEVQRLKPYA